MNKQFLIAISVLVASFLMSLEGFCQDSTEPETTPIKSIIKIAPFQFTDNTFFLAYEGFNADYTKSFNLGIGFKTNSNSNDEELGFKFEGQYRFYVNGFKEYSSRKSGVNYTRGIYASVFLSSLVTQIESEFSTFDPVGNFTNFRTNERNITAFNPGVTIGIQRSFWDILYVDVFVGGGVRFANIRDSDPLFAQNRSRFVDIYDPEYEGVFPKIGVNIGIGF